MILSWNVVFSKGISTPCGKSLQACFPTLSPFLKIASAEKFGGVKTSFLYFLSQRDFWHCKPLVYKDFDSFDCYPTF